MKHKAKVIDLDKELKVRADFRGEIGSRAHEAHHRTVMDRLLARATVTEARHRKAK